MARILHTAAKIRSEWITRNRSTKVTVIGRLNMVPPFESYASKEWKGDLHQTGCQNGFFKKYKNKSLHSFGLWTSFFCTRLPILGFLFSVKRLPPVEPGFIERKTRCLFVAGFTTILKAGPYITLNFWRAILKKVLSNIESRLLLIESSWKYVLNK